MMARKKQDSITVPFTIRQDTREVQGGMMWTFTGLVGDSADKYRPLVVPTEVVYPGLRTGDYSIKGYEESIVIERKSAADLFGCCTNGSKDNPDNARDRFEAEHQRMQEIIRRGGIACVIIEADWPTMLLHPPGHTRLSPGSVFGTSISWMVKYQVPWIACPGRRFAELTAFRILRKFWEENHKQSELEKVIEL